MNSTPPPTYGPSSSTTPNPTQVPVTFHVNKGKPWVTYTILAVTVVIYGLQALSLALTNNNYDLPYILGGKINEFILQGQVWRLITPVFLHGSVLHIAFNMYALFTIGPGLEQFYGRWRYLLLYMVGGYCGNVLSFVLSANPSIGASTAIFGLVAAEIVFIYRNRILFGNKAKNMLLNLAFVVVVNLGFGMVQSGIDNWGHLGGILGGLAFSWFGGPHYKVQPSQTGLELKDSHQKHDVVWATLLSAGLFTAVVIGRFLAG
jgi:rhomboid protease GluP